jgi:hypothetical protein
MGVESYESEVFGSAPSRWRSDGDGQDVAGAWRPDLHGHRDHRADRPPAVACAGAAEGGGRHVGTAYELS